MNNEQTQPRIVNPTVRVMSNDRDAMNRIHEIGMLQERERVAALREWQAEQRAAREKEQPL